MLWPGDDFMHRHNVDHEAKEREDKERGRQELTRKGTRQKKIQEELTRARYGYRILVGEKTYSTTYQ
jgi:hypothetical protein